MSKKLFVSLCVCCLVLGAVTLVSAERPKPAEKVAFEGQDNVKAQRSGPAVKNLDTPVQTKAPKNRNLGTITYDDGTLTAFPAISSYCYGNQFNTANGAGVMASGSVTAVQFFMAPGAGTDNVFLSVFGPVSGTAASVLTSASVPAASNTFNMHTFATPINYGGASFLAGVWYISGDTVGLGTGTAGGQGYHGMLINDIAGTGFQPLSTLNALVRASGDVMIPVELMTFSVQ